MKKFTTRLLSALFTLTVLLCSLPLTTAIADNAEPAESAIVSTPADNETAALTLDDVLAGRATAEEVFGTFTEDVVPDIVGFESAVNSGHVARLYEEEGDELNNVIFLNKDGTQTMYLFADPVKYVDNSGNIKDISLDIVSAPKSASAAFTSANDNALQTAFAQKLSDGITLSGDGVSLKLVPHLPSSDTVVMSTGKAAQLTATTQPITMTSNAQLINNKTVSYRYDDKTTLEYSLTYTGFKEDIVVSEYTGQTAYYFTLYTNGLTLTEQDGFHVLTDETGAVRATVGEIIVFTADERNNTFGELTAATIKENEEYRLTIRLDADWLADENTVYPIRIDPELSVEYSQQGVGAIQDITLYENGTVAPTSQMLYVGKKQSNGIMRMLIKVPGLTFTGSMDDIYITEASICLRDIMCQESALSIYCHAYTYAEWNESTTDWSTLSLTGVSDTLSSQFVSYANGAAKDEPHWYSFDITKAVEGWKVGNFNINKGLFFRGPASQDTSNLYSYKTFGSFNHSSFKPYVTYTFHYLTSMFNDTYYLNNREHGDYLKRAIGSTILSAESGSIYDLTSSIRWRMDRISAGYLLRSSTDNSQFLGVPQALSNQQPMLFTLTDGMIPDRYIWTLQPTNNGGYFLKSNYSSVYMYWDGSTLYTSGSVGEVGSSTYNSHVWRIADVSSMYTRELRQTSKFSAITMHYNESKPVNLSPIPNQAYWVDWTDFIFSNYDSECVTYANGTFTAHPSLTTPYSCTVAAHHKVTDLTFYFRLTIPFNAILIGVDDNDPTNDDNYSCCSDNNGTGIPHDHASSLTAITPTLQNLGYNTQTFTGRFFASDITDRLDNDTNEIFVIRCHGGPVLDPTTHAQCGTAIYVDDLDDTQSISSTRTYSWDLSNMKLIVLVSCATGVGGEGGLNLPTQMIEDGAETVVAFKTTINCESANQWTIRFFSQLAQGKTVTEACDDIDGGFTAESGIQSYVVFGNKNLTLT